VSTHAHITVPRKVIFQAPMYWPVVVTHDPCSKALPARTWLIASARKRRQASEVQVTTTTCRCLLGMASKGRTGFRCDGGVAICMGAERPFVDNRICR
jgi:hypothetical protein